MPSEYRQTTLLPLVETMVESPGVDHRAAWQGGAMAVGHRTRVSGVIGIGYQGRDLDSFVAELRACGVTRLIDVRLTPISRKRGFSKTALCQALQEAGIAYDHRPQLGNPKDNRAGFSGTPQELARARQVFAALLQRPEAARCLEDLAEAARHEQLALLCFEADQERCHRDVVMRELTALTDQPLG